jgi:ABC-2 type transport system ATP-binding protein
MAQLRAASAFLSTRETPALSIRGLRWGASGRPLDLQLRAGEVVAVVAAHGGLLPVLAGAQAAAEGLFSVAGRELAEDPAEARWLTGLVGQACPAGGTTLRSALVSHGQLMRLSRAQARDRAEELAFDLELGPVLDLDWDELTPGELLRGRIALALLHRPAVLLLDDPAAGLSPEEGEELRAVLRMVRDQDGTAVLLTTPDLAAVALLADRAVPLP